MRLRNLLPLLAGIFVLLTSTAMRASTITGTVKGPDGSMQLRHEPIPDLPEELKQVVEEMK